MIIKDLYSSELAEDFSKNPEFMALIIKLVEFCQCENYTIGSIINFEKFKDENKQNFDKLDESVQLLRCWLNLKNFININRLIFPLENFKDNVEGRVNPVSYMLKKKQLSTTTD